MLPHPGGGVHTRNVALLLILRRSSISSFVRSITVLFAARKSRDEGKASANKLDTRWREMYSPMIRSGVTDFVRTSRRCGCQLSVRRQEARKKRSPLTLGVLAWSEMRTFAGETLCFSAMRVTMGLVIRGELSDPRGENEVITMPCFVHASTISS